jgi:uncharacterized membrane protein YsdA (DUF1294 family)/cold shock CspA family protein
MRYDGTLKMWNEQRGFGFIQRDGGGEVFVHAKGFAHGISRLAVGDRLTFEIEVAPDGRQRAHSARVQRARSRLGAWLNAPSAPGTLPRLLVLPLFAGLWLYVDARWGVSPITMAVYGGVSVLTLLVYAIDKRSASNDRRRIPESQLHNLGLMCGWPGAVVAQQILRHKTSKTEFVLKFWATVTFNVIGFVAWHRFALTQYMSW